MPTTLKGVPVFPKCMLNSLSSALMNSVSWEESPLEVPESLSAGAPKLNNGRAVRTFSGSLKGEGEDK
jgi:hypothetical protein